MEERVCPICGEVYSGYSALSRKDNKTLICPACGQKEAVEDYIAYMKARTSNKESK